MGKFLLNLEDLCLLFSLLLLVPKFCKQPKMVVLGIFLVTYKIVNLETWKRNNSILLHGGLNPAWHFWLSTRFSCCLKMKSVENILGYVREQFYRCSRGCKPPENLWNCARKYTKMFNTDPFLGNKKMRFNQNVWRDHATMQQDVLLHFGVKSGWSMKKNILVSSSRTFSLSTPLEISAVCQL